MMTVWKNYQSYPRIAVVQNTACGEIPAEQLAQREHLLIQNESISFSSDGYCTAAEASSGIFSLMSGDIITIDDRGVIYRVYSREENDATFFITGHCNSNCIMCPSSIYERKKNSGMSDDWMRQYLRMLPAETGHVVVTGGEPTLRTNLFFEVMEGIADRFPDIETLLLTNGRAFASSVMTEKLVQHCPQYLCAAVPLHASTPALHDRITQAPGSFDQTTAGIKNLLAKGIGIEIRVVVSKLNIHDLQNTADFIIKHFPNVLVVNFVGLETRGSCVKNFDEVYIGLSESSPAILPAINRLAKAGIDAALYNYPLCAVDRGYWACCKQSISPEKVRYAEACDICEAKSYCGGFFHTTLAMAKPSVNPIIFSS